MDKKVNGLKGICCLIVAVGHAFSILLPKYYFGDSIATNFAGAKIVYSSPLNFLINGSSALICFFILSGYVIPLKKIKTNCKQKFWSKWGGRYLRLMPMVLIGCMISWCIMKLNQVWSLKLIDVTGCETYVGIYNNFSPESIVSTDGPVVDSMIKVFLGWSRYNSPLGTIGWIWLFSALLLLYTKFLSARKIRFLIYFLTIAASISLCSAKFELIYLTPMMIGMAICDFQYIEAKNGRTGVIQNNFIKIAISFIGIYMITIPRASFTGGIYAWIWYLGIPVYYYWIIGWTIVIYMIEKHDLFVKFLSCRVIQALGNISFAIYAVHWPIVISLTSALAYGVHYGLGLNYELSALLSILVSTPCIIGIAYIINRYPYGWLCSLENRITKMLEKLIENKKHI